MEQDAALYSIRYLQALLNSIVRISALSAREMSLSQQQALLDYQEKVKKELLDHVRDYLAPQPWLLERFDGRIFDIMPGDLLAQKNIVMNVK